ncbi:MAG: hypothetical protein K2W95_21820 [Candidatus Obscuribacterales bacterium]|nr:hypothetical protein [Candidatus Obscuribacterales bacterium]
MRLLNLAVLVMIGLAVAAPVSADAPLTMMLKGRVLSPEHHPVSGAKIFVHDEETGDDVKGSSDGKGHFAIKHAECNFFSFVVVPPPESGLSRAHFEHVSGEAGKHFIVQLRRGFVVTGRITSGGVGIKGLHVRFSANDDGMTNAEVVHGGGITTTGRNGEFELTLTPGQKIIEIRNDRYRDIAAITTQQVTVSGDTKLPDFVLPNREKK